MGSNGRHNLTSRKCSPKGRSFLFLKWTQVIVIAMQPWKKWLPAFGELQGTSQAVSFTSCNPHHSHLYRAVLAATAAFLFTNKNTEAWRSKLISPVLTANRATELRHKSISLGVKAEFLLMPTGPPQSCLPCFLDLHPHRSPDHSVPATLMWPFHGGHTRQTPTSGPLHGPWNTFPQWPYS